MSNPKRLVDFFLRYKPLLAKLMQAQNELISKLESEIGKKAKGDQIVSLIGEGAVVALLNGVVKASESAETDVEVNGKRISVKARRGRRSGWTQTSAIPTNNVNAVDFMAFVHLADDYSVDTIWLFQWPDLVKSGRIKTKTVRGEPRGYTFRLSPRKDSKHIIYSTK